MNTEKMIYEQLLDDKNIYDIRPDLVSYNSYIRELGFNKCNQIDLKEFKLFINTSDKKNILLNSLNGIDKSILYKSNTHGISHNERVSLYGFYIGMRLGLSDNDINLVLEGCKYHDIGRINDYEDRYHGARSADLLVNVEHNISNDDLEILRFIVTYHSIDDKKFDELLNQYKIKDLDRLRILCNILKDADALDRTRLCSYGLDPSYLRLDVSRSMILLSYELFYNYECVKKRIRSNKI